MLTALIYCAEVIGLTVGNADFENNLTLVDKIP